MAKAIIIDGMKFGKLTVVKQSETKNRARRYECICECGRTVTRRSSHIRHGASMACKECLKEERRARPARAACRICGSEFEFTSEFFTVDKKTFFGLKKLCKPCSNNETRDCSRKVRMIAIFAYGGKCACCGERRHEFLCFDHVNNDGKKDREQNRNGATLYRRLIKEGFPDRFQLLCHNCNYAKQVYKVCPHKIPLDDDQ